MKIIHLAMASLILVSMLTSCATTAPGVEKTTPPATEEKIQPPVAEEKALPLVVEDQVEAEEELPPPLQDQTTDEVPFDPSTITKEVFDTTKTDVQALIARLNGIIREKNYTEWVTYLGERYRGSLNDPAFLHKISESSVLRKQGVVLRELRDYFIYVVVPSRANDRVDDIEFIGQNRVKAFTIDSKGRRLRLYDLEKAPSGWKIVN